MGADFQAIITLSEMSDEMQKMAAEVSAEASTRYNTFIEISKHIKETFEKRYGNVWQCVVGKQFASYVSFDENDFILFRLEDISVLLFRCN